MSRITSVLTLLLCTLFIVPAHAQEKKNGKVSITDKDGNISTGKNKKGKHVGEWSVKTPDGHLLEVVNYKNGVYEGQYTLYFTSRRVYKTGAYLNGKRNGLWYEFSDKGDTAEIQTFRNDTLNGYFLGTDFYGRTLSGDYVNGKQEGMWLGFVKGTFVTTIDTMYYLNGELDGVYKTYTEGKLRQITYYKAGKREGNERKYYVGNGQLEKSSWYRHGLRDSIWHSYSEDGLLKNVSWYENDLAARYDSAWSFPYNKRTLHRVLLYSSPGVISFRQEHGSNGAILYQYFEHNDGGHDSIFMFYPNGIVASRTYSGKNPYEAIENSFSRYEKKYSAAGTITSYGWYGRGGKIGVWVYLDSASGKKTKEIYYFSDRPEGTYKSYYPNGKIKVAGVCRHGYLQDSIVVYTSSGKLLKKGTAQYDDVFVKDIYATPGIAYLDPSIPTEVERLEDYDVAAPVEMIEEAPKEDGVFTFAEVMPSFPGDSLQNYINKQLKYPQMEKEAGIEGTVYIQFIVEKDGSISNVLTLREVQGAPGFTKEAIRIIKSMPKWNPGKVNGKPARVKVVLPVKFRLQ